ncbi:ABC transporter permease [Pedobacter foliorum]|uniref:ABC transporter permease n=1 Tax=Pedobacter foliorum TaxID=2739058 RepID=UPI0015639EBD|nr:FtsX-like permease family protein [Pedobacter foliorum]NRF37087.1 ABC transporter permease [Pedobacter foliorum]
MFKHLFKLIWNKRKQNFLFLSEILVSFMVIFAVFSLLVFYYLNYIKPNGIEYEKVWSIQYSNPLKTSNVDSLETFYENVRRTIKALPQVQELSFSVSNYPYSNSHSTTGFTYKGKELSPIDNYMIEDDYHKVLGMRLLSGRWFNKEDKIGKKRNVVINSTLKQAMFGDAEAVGAVVGADNEKETWKVIGVVADVKASGDFLPAGKGFYKRLDSGAFGWIGTILIKVSPDADAAFESRLHKLLARTIQNSNLEIQHLEDMRDSTNEDTIIPMIICITVAGFLIINVALGLFGVLWYNISQRRGEIGLRRALGATGSSVSFQLVSESLMLATLSIIVGSFFALQFPLLNVFNVPTAVYIIALLLSIAFIYLLVIFCSLYPGKQAAAIHPAIALHEE